MSQLEQVENTAFIREFQRRESKDAINFYKNMPQEKKAELTGKKDYASSKATLKSALKNSVPHSNLQAGMSDPELLNHLSMNLWRRINAGYMVERRNCVSLSRASYQYDPKLIETCSREFMHKRDMFSEYVEAAARFKCLIKSTTVPEVPKYVPRALRPQTPGRKWYAPVMKLPPGYQGSGSSPSPQQVNTPSSPPPASIPDPSKQQAS